MIRTRWMGIGLLVAAAAGCAPELSEDAPEDPQVAEFIRVCAAGPTVRGLDVSHHEGAINWSRVRAAGYRFAFVRATYGSGLRDRRFDDNWSGARAAGVIRGAYHFLLAGQDVAAQARLFISTVGHLERGDLPPVVDVESMGNEGVSSTTMVSATRRFIALVRDGLGRAPIVYTSQGYWNTLRGTSEFAARPLWVANYTMSCPRMPDTWSRWTFWQHSETGRVPGIPADAADLDVFNGTIADLEAFANDGATPVPPTPPADAASPTADAAPDVAPPRPSDSGVRPMPPPGPAGPGRGFPTTGPWVSSYGTAAQMGDLSRVASTYRIINVDVDPDQGGITDAQIATLRAGGTNRVISYLNLGACESYRGYWSNAPAGFVSCSANRAAHLGAYDGYPDEQWMDAGNADYQHLMVDYVAARLAARGVDGFFLDNLELLTHGTATSNGPCNARCAQGGLDFVRRLRTAFPNHLIVMQNGTGDFTRTGVTGGVPFAELLDGITHEEVYASTYDADAERELLAWRDMGLRPGGRPFFIGTEDYVGSCANTTAARNAYTRSRANGFSPYASDASARMMGVCYWGF